MSHEAHISGIFIYPVTSTAALAVDRAAVEPRGLAEDRRWVVTDESGEFLTGREHPRLVMIRARPAPDGLTLRAPGMPGIEVATPGLDGRRSPLQVWNDRCGGLSADDDANTWLSEFLGVRCRLHYMDAGGIRSLAGTDDGEVSFADNYPLRLTAGASLADLNARLQRPMDMRRFRPNLVASGTRAYEEDGGQHALIIDTADFALEDSHASALVQRALP